MKTVITGSIAFDYHMSFPGRFSEHLLAEQLDSISVSFLVDSMRRMRGGVAPNIAYTNALLGPRQNWLKKRQSCACAVEKPDTKITDTGKTNALGHSMNGKGKNVCVVCSF